MIELKEELQSYASCFDRLQQRAGGPAWLRQLRVAAMARFTELGFPTRRQEEWKYTSVAPVAKGAFAFGDGLIQPPEGVDPLAGLDCHRLAFVNGRFRADLSSVLDGVEAGSLSAALNTGNELVENHLARYASYQNHPFVALNTALLEDGAAVRIPAGTILEKPLYLLWLSSGEQTMSHPRSLIVVGAGSQVSIIEAYAGFGEGVYFTNPVSEIVVGENSIVEYYKVQRERPGCYHVATIQSEQQRGSTLHSHSASFGAALVRNDINSVLDGEGAECVLDGLYTGGGAQHIDNHTTLDHAQPHCSTREYYHGILGGRASGVFSGRIIVRKDAQKTDAIQSNKNLLLSEEASINSKPQLEIYADDVRCTHGATVGQLDADALFYLRSRGIRAEEARNMLIAAFAGGVLDRIRMGALRERLEEMLRQDLQSLLPVQQAAGHASAARSRLHEVP
ncbi:MAG: Fe-S cluster assembly protein SufD [Bryobacterales bacterium]|nr:Fe-S cluster assembly protein SufD [Bryobacterales bacterium]